MIKFRASSLGELMTDPKSIDESLVTEEVAAIQKKKVRTDEEKALLQSLLDRSLSAGAKTFLKNLAKEFRYGYTEIITSKYMDKGIEVEDEAIQLYNDVFFTDYAKNKERKTNDWLTGECDIFTGTKIIDIKSSWSWGTFPDTAEDGKDTGYEWQGRAYMMLWDVDEFELAYCMLNTPDDLIKYEQADMHYADHMPKKDRITIVRYTRDRALEEKIKRKIEAARDYLQRRVDQIEREHQLL